MKILMIASENDAIHGAKVGGVGDVLRDIPPALVQLGHQVDVVLPDYGNAALLPFKKKVAQFLVPFSGFVYPVELFALQGGQYDKREESLYVISSPLFTGHNGQVYCTNDEHGPFAQDATKFSLFNTAICEALIQGYLSTPDVIHLHDWHAACVAVLRAYEPSYKSLKKIPTVYTVHNLALQGIRPLSGDTSSLHTWFPQLNYSHQVISDPRYRECFNPMRAGILLADKIHLVSPSYVDEVTKSSNPEQGFFGGEGLEADLNKRHKQGNVFGILNGCDYSVKLPRKPTKKALYDQIQSAISTAIGKNLQLRSVDYLANERAKQWQNDRQSGLLMTSIGRLTDQKMLILRQQHQGKPALAHLLEKLAKRQGRLIILGSGDPTLEALLTQIMGQYDNFMFINTYADSLSNSLYQYGDLFLMPSSFEPCGISQMLAMRSGQPCFVHAVGGLKDTVIHKQTGFSFEGKNLELQVKNMLKGFDEVLDVYENDPEQWKAIAKKAKATRFLWKDSLERYQKDLYSA